MVETIAVIAGIFSGLGVILGALWKVHRLLTKLEKKYDEMNEMIKENTMCILKMAVVSKPKLSKLQAVFTPPPPTFDENVVISILEP